MAWGKAGSTTLGSAGDTITVSGMTANEFNMILLHEINASGNNSNERQTFNNNSNSVYAWRQNNNGGTDSTTTGNAYINLGISSKDEFRIQYLCSISGEEKLGISYALSFPTAGAGTAPDRREDVYKFVPSPDADITRVDINNTDTGDYSTDSNLSVLGSDLTPKAALGANIQLGSRYEETDTRKMYNLQELDTNVLYEDATGHSNTSSHGTVVFIGDNATYATLFQRDIAATNTTHPHPAVNVDTPNKAFSSSDPWIIELTFKESYTIPSGSTITYNSYNNGQGARLKYLDFQVYTGSTWENITGTITNPNHSDGDVETTSGRWVKYMTSTTTTEKTGTKFRIRMWDSWDNYVTNGRHYIGGIELKIPIGNVEWQEIGA